MSSKDFWILISKQVLTYNYFCKNVCITFWTWILAQLDELYRMAQLARRSDEVQILLQAKDAWMLTFRLNIFTWQHYFSTCDHFLFTSRYLGWNLCQDHFHKWCSYLKIQTSLMSSIDFWILISKQVLTYNYFCKNVCITFWTWILAQLDELFRMAQLARRSDEVQILLQAKDAWMLTFRHNIFTWQHYLSTCDHFLCTSRYLGAFNKEIFALDIIFLLQNAIVPYLA